eukprot:gene14545-20585_t
MALMQKSSLGLAKTTRSARVSRASVVVRAEAVSRREILSGVVSAATLMAAAPAFAAYGDSANVFGRTTNASNAIPYAGDGYSLNIPSKWNPSREQEFRNTVFRYVDNGDAVNSICVIADPTSKSSVKDFGSTDQFLNEYGFLLGQQSYSGETMSEGGFAPNRVSAASILDVQDTTDKKGRPTYFYEILTRTQDGNEGGRHQLIKATVADGKVWIIKAQIGDKRWFKGANKDAMLAMDSFTVA